MLDVREQLCGALQNEGDNVIRVERNRDFARSLACNLDFPPEDSDFSTRGRLIRDANRSVKCAILMHTVPESQILMTVIINDI